MCCGSSSFIFYFSFAFFEGQQPKTCFASTTVEFLTSTIPLALMASESIEPIPARGIIVLVKSNYVVGQKISRQNNFSQLKLDFNPFLPPKSRRFALLVGYKIQPSSSSTNQNAALMIEHYLDFTNNGQSIMGLIIIIILQ